MPSRGQLALIHIAKKELRLPDEVYRDILFALFRKESAADLSAGEVSRLLDHFRMLGWRPRDLAANSDTSAPRGKKYDSLGQRPGMATPAQLRKIEADWMTGPGIHEKTLLALRHFLQHRFHVSGLRFVKAGQVTPILAAIHRMAQTGPRMHANKKNLHHKVTKTQKTGQCRENV